MNEDVPPVKPAGWQLDEDKLGYWSFDVETGLFDCSPQSRHMLGFPMEGIISQERFLEAVHEEDRSQTWHEITFALVSAEPRHVEFRAAERSGEAPRWIALFGFKLTEHAVSHGLLVDVTAWRAAEQSATENKERFRFLAEFLPEKVFTTKPHGELEYLNAQWAIYTGCPTETILELGWRDFVHPDDIEEKARRWTQAMKNGTPFEFEHRFRRADGAYRWHLSRARPMRRGDGSITMWVGTNTDVDDLKRAQFELHESESRSRLAMEAGKLGFWDWNLDGRIKWSPEHNRMLGLDPNREEGTFEEGIQQVYPADLKRIEEALEQAKRERQDLEVEFRVVPPEGGPLRWIAAHGRAYYDEETGRPVRMIGVVRDVTERRKFEERLRQSHEELRGALSAAEHAREQAEAGSRAKDQFLAVLSHELRTPLTPVLMGISSLRMERDLSDSVRDVLEMIQRNIKTEARLIDDLLDLTRIARNKVELRLAPMDLHRAVRQALEICESDLDSKKLRVQVDLAAEHSQVSGDFERLQQVFWNLIKNAVKFTPAEGRIMIRSYTEGDRIFVEVADSGLGIAQEALIRIFNPFEQGNSGRHLGGLGLGLAISKATIDAHGGRITARSPGKNLGATFLVELGMSRN